MDVRSTASEALATGRANRATVRRNGAAMVLEYLLVMAFVYSAPVMLILWLVRRRINRRTGGALVAVAFAAATMYSLWRFDWFDVWRHGVPSAGFMLRTYLPWLIAYGLVGWFVGGRIVGRRRRLAI